MSEKEPVKFSLLTCLLILGLIVVVIIGFYIYKNKTDENIQLDNSKVLSDDQVVDNNIEKSNIDLEEKSTDADTSKDKISDPEMKKALQDFI